MTLTLDFQGQFFNMLYLRNGRVDWHGTKGMWVDRMLHPLCDSILTSTMTSTLDFQGQILKKSYLRNGMADWHGIKGMWVNRMLDQLGHSIMLFQLFPHPWPWPWIFKVKFLEKFYLMNEMADWHGTKGMWVDRMLDPCCDFQCSPLSWPWLWIFKVKFWKSRISGMGWPIDMEWKGCESIECYSHCDFKLWPHPWNCCNSGMGGSTHLEWKGCELDMMLDAQWDWPWATVHGK